MCRRRWIAAAGGSLTVTTSRGTLTLELAGPVQTGFAPLPRVFGYRVTGGTGAYQGATGGGSIQLTLGEGTPAPDGGMQGLVGMRFTL